MRKIVNGFSVAAIGIVVCLIDVSIFAQQSANVDDWRAEYSERVKTTIERRLKEKTNFLNDVQTTKPDFIVYVPQVNPEKLGDCYNDHFQVFEGLSGILFATTCQATCEGALDQHITFFRSYDRGKTWSEPKVLAGPKTFHSNSPIASWGFAMVSKSGRIYVLYNQYQEGKVSTNRQHTGLMAGIYSDDLGDTWSSPQLIPLPRSSYDSPDETIPPEWVVWQHPLRLGEHGKYLVGVTRYVAPQYHDKCRTVTEFIRFENIDDDPEPKDIITKWFMTDDKALSKGLYCEEPSIVKLPDGRLFALMRTGIGYPCWSVSEDLGETWSLPEILRDRDDGRPYLHPVSPCPIYDWKGETSGSGYYFAFIHNRFDFEAGSPWQNRGPLYLIAGAYQEGARQPIWFGEPQLFINRPSSNSFYTSMTMIDGNPVLWYPDQKFYLLGRFIDESWFKNSPELSVTKDDK